MNQSNAVTLRGAVSTTPTEVEVGAETRIEFRLVVPRESGGNDSLNCFVVDSRLLARAGKLSEGKRLEVAGELRSRFWRAAGRTAATMEVEVQRMRLL